MSLKRKKKKKKAWVWPSLIESWNVGLYLREENTSDTLSLTIHADPHLICNNRYLLPLSCFPYIRSSTLYLSRYLFYHLHISKQMLSLSLSLSLSLFATWRSKKPKNFVSTQYVFTGQNLIFVSVQPKWPDMTIVFKPKRNYLVWRAS